MLREELTSSPNGPTFMLDDLPLHWQMTRWEKYALYSLLNYIRPEVAIEIGTYKGGSLQVISNLARKVYSVDISPEPQQHLKSRFSNVEFLVGDSKSILPDLLQRIAHQGEDLGFILIDGDHSTEGVRSDINIILANYKPVCPLYIIMHDAFNPECRAGILSANWPDCRYVHFLEIDFIPGVYHFEAFDTAESKSMWAGFALALMLPYERSKPLTIYQSQRGAFDTIYQFSRHAEGSQIPNPDQAEVDRLRAELEALKQKVKLMEASKFWKLRNFWVKLKRIFKS